MCVGDHSDRDKVVEEVPPVAERPQERDGADPERVAVVSLAVRDVPTDREAVIVEALRPEIEGNNDPERVVIVSLAVRDVPADHEMVDAEGLRPEIERNNVLVLLLDNVSNLVRVVTLAEALWSCDCV